MSAHGPAYPEHSRWGKVLKDKDYDVACDQSALVFVYLLFNNQERLGNKTFIETEYFFQPTGTRSCRTSWTASMALPRGKR